MNKPLFRVKKGASYVLSMEMATLVGWLARRWEESGLGAFVITSAQDGMHREESLHYSGNAVDIRTRHLFNTATGKHNENLIQFAMMVQSFFSKRGVRVVVHPDWVSGTPHLHIGYKPRESDDYQFNSGIWEWSE